MFVCNVGRCVRQPGTSKILRNHGVRDVQGVGYGNLIVTFQVYVPSSVTEEQKRLLSQVDPTSLAVASCTSLLSHVDPTWSS